ncbi:hypothetical protein KSF_108400 [Reticulibacter mediterranei]|uniref:Uncharacterized protein n=2 Tax=Reticulibacter mediterranei TaxID=2778369 RepID=A0A8J3N6V7_9CHLR|nr:hypothetical protein KSF_108400 [Reticulibacter mediterranei]
MVLGLDAVDEALHESGKQNALRKLLLWSWEQEGHLRQQPRATLIVTCRNTNELAHWLGISSPYEYELKPFHEVEVVVDEFSKQELILAVSLHLPIFAERFTQTYEALSPHGMSLSDIFDHPDKMRLFLNETGLRQVEAWQNVQPESLFLPAVHAEVFEALRHPTLWHCLLKLDGAMQSRVLDGDAEALAHLASRFLFWFCTKVQARGKRMRHEEMIEVLKVIARHCDPHQSPLHQQKEWMTHASRTAYMNHNQAKNFFEEALSAGLIVPDKAGWWRWRHAFIGEYLARQPFHLEEDDG